MSLTDKNKKRVKHLHEFEREVAFQEANKNAHLYYYGYTPLERDFEFARTFSEIYTSIFCMSGFWSIDPDMNIQKLTKFPRYKFYVRARVCADCLGADYYEYIRAQIDRFQNSPVQFFNKKSQTKETKSLPTLRDCASQGSVNAFYEWRKNNSHPMSPIFTRPHRDLDLRVETYDPKLPTDRQLDYWKKVMETVKSLANINKKTVPEMMREFVSWAVCLSLLLNPFILDIRIFDMFSRIGRSPIFCHDLFCIKKKDGPARG